MWAIRMVLAESFHEKMTTSECQGVIGLSEGCQKVVMGAFLFHGKLLPKSCQDKIAI